MPVDCGGGTIDEVVPTFGAPDGIKCPNVAMVSFAFLMLSSDKQPLVQDWLPTPETLMMLNRHRSKYRGRFMQG